ncbi:MAG: ribose 5-phosphate isomerase B [Clostridiales bacterium]|nr:ribose 5-phosphate isomerase B [Clostridiales bacterium]
MNIAIGCDHTGLELKQIVTNHLKERGFAVRDYGYDGTGAADYPIYGERVGRAVASGECELGVLICGTGIGISLSANRVRGVRAAACSEPYSAQMARRHNDCNIVAFGARVVGQDLALMIVDHFLDAEFEGGRHARRVALIEAIDRGQ